MTIDEFKINYCYEEGKLITKNEIIYLTFIENEIIKLLVDNYNKHVRTEKICLTLYKEQLDYCYTRTIATNIARVRKKLKGIVKINNRHGFGYNIIIL